MSSKQLNQIALAKLRTGAHNLLNSRCVVNNHIRKKGITYVGYIGVHRSIGHLGTPLLYWSS